jgi:hypothetical protein
MKNNSKKRMSLFERYPIITTIITVTISVLVLDVLLTIPYNYHKEIKIKRQIERNKKIRIQHPVYHHTFKNNTKSSEKNILGEYTIFTNSLGFKDQSSRKIPMKSINQRILFIGDSFTEGIWLNYDDSFVGIIDAKLRKKQIEVLNAGRSSYSPIIYWRKIKYLIEDVGLKIDEVVVFIDISDAQDEARNYDLSDNMNVISRHKVDQSPQTFQPSKSDAQDEARNYALSDNMNVISRHKVDQSFKILQSPKSLTLLLKNIISRKTTFLYYTLNLLYDSIGFGAAEGGAWSTLISSNYIRDKWTIDESAYTTYGMNGVILMKKYINKLLFLLKDNNIDLTIAVYPHPSQIWYEDLASIQVDVWKKWSQENNINFINYFPDFVSKGLSKTEKLQILRKYYVFGDSHFNKEGNLVLAHKFIETYLNWE